MDETVSDCRRLQFEQTELSVSFLLILHVCKFPGSTILNVTFIVFSDSVGLLVFLVGRRQNNRRSVCQPVNLHLFSLLEADVRDVGRININWLL